MNFATYINETISSMINESAESEQEKNALKLPRTTFSGVSSYSFRCASGVLHNSGLQRIMRSRLNRFNFQEIVSLIRLSIFYTLEYVKLQPPEFKKMYIRTFVMDCVQAYDAEDDAAISCASGALERIVMSLVPACQSILSGGQKNDDYEKIVAIIIANPEKLIPEYILDWYKMHNPNNEGGVAFPKGTTANKKKLDLKKYLLEKFPGEESTIKANIAEIADNIGYEDDDFSFGGRRKRSRRRKTRKSSRKANAKTSRT